MKGMTGLFGCCHCAKIKTKRIEINNKYLRENSPTVPFKWTVFVQLLPELVGSFHQRSAPYNEFAAIAKGLSL